MKPTRRSLLSALAGFAGVAVAKLIRKADPNKSVGLPATPKMPKSGVARDIAYMDAGRLFYNLDNRCLANRDFDFLSAQHWAVLDGSTAEPARQCFAKDLLTPSVQLVFDEMRDENQRMSRILDAIYSDKIAVTELWPRQNDRLMVLDMNIPTQEECIKRFNSMLADWNSTKVVRIMNPDGSVKYTNIA